jgi:hypothetical protein
MNEADLKGQLVHTGRQLLRNYVILRHEDQFTSGIPDVSFTGDTRTAWMEAKVINPAHPYPRSRKIQKLTCARLAAVGICWYVIWDLRNDSKRTWIVHPQLILEERNFESTSIMMLGFDHHATVEFVRSQCRDYVRTS